MLPSSLPVSRDLVLIGGGHSHALVLRAWGMTPLPGARLTLINPGPTAPYSGMLPGHIAGHYSRDALDIDLVKLARFSGARLILGAAERIDLDAGEIHVKGRAPIGFDIAALDIGITSTMPTLPGFAEHGVPAKPLGAFASAWATYRAGSGKARVAVIGAGVAGAEIAMAMAHALRSDKRPAEITLVDRSDALSALKPGSAAKLRAHLKGLGVSVIEHAEVTEVTAQGVHLADGRFVEAEFVTGASGARPYDWLQTTGLKLIDGFVEVDDRLRSSDARIFATGDCAHLSFDPRPKAGVFAVRQAPVLTQNLRTALTETGTYRRYKPQKDYLKLISLGARSALAERFGFSPSGPMLWRWKDQIDQRFMDQFKALPAPKPPALPAPRAAGSAEALGPKPMCGGCGSKIGHAALSRALARRASSPTAPAHPGDDAGILQTGGVTQVISTDHLRALVLDPDTMARIAVTHALGDIWAMGATPQAATLSVILPQSAPDLAERSLTEILHAAQDVLDAAGAALVGGHSTQGAELTIGATLTGICATAPITLAGAQPGDLLVLTKPVGTGVIMAADMAGTAPGAIVAQAIAHMTQPQGQAAHLLRSAHAMTDVTGFGLAGHLANMCHASGTGAQLTRAAVPVLPGALELSKAGVRSTLFPENRAILPDLPDDPLTDLLFDPQTCGGLLAALPAAHPHILEDLQNAGIPAQVIGKMTDQPGRIEIS